MLGFIIGLFVGVFIGTGFMALFYASGRESDEEYRRERSKMIKNKTNSDKEKDNDDADS